jgi:hypothetical protein
MVELNVFSCKTISSIYAYKLLLFIIYTRSGSNQVINFAPLLFILSYMAYSINYQSSQLFIKCHSHIKH